jgi:hypothetical protein
LKASKEIKPKISKTANLKVIKKRTLVMPSPAKGLEVDSDESDLDLNLENEVEGDCALQELEQQALQQGEKVEDVALNQTRLHRLNSSTGLNQTQLPRIAKENVLLLSPKCPQTEKRKMRKRPPGMLPQALLASHRAQELFSLATSLTGFLNDKCKNISLNLEP